MIFPVRTDRRLRHSPWMNTSIVVLNVVIFLLVRTSDEMYAASYEFYLFPYAPEWYQFFTYQFLHADIWHIGFNMLFLWVFGQHLEDRFGPLGYLAFYLAGGIVAGLGHAIMEQSPVLGASGAVSAVTGAYLALFPASRCTLMFWFFFIYFFEIPSMYLILFSFFQDVFFQLLGSGHVAYLAHISGSIFGFAIGMGLLVTRILPREPYDFLALVDRWNRRRQLRSVTRSGNSPWTGSVPGSMKAEAPASAEEQEMMGLRSKITGAINNDQSDVALEDYRKLLALDPDLSLPRQTQLDLANYAMQHEHHDLAARAYEVFLKTFKTDSFAPEVKMILALIYIRYLDRSEEARPLLEQAVEQLDNEDQKKLANHLLSELNS